MVVAASGAALSGTPTVADRKTVTREELGAFLHKETWLSHGLPPEATCGYCLGVAEAILQRFAALPESADEGLREALRKWLFPKGFDHPGTWSLTNEGAAAIARAAFAATLPEPGEGS